MVFSSDEGVLGTRSAVKEYYLADRGTCLAPGGTCEGSSPTSTIRDSIEPDSEVAVGLFRVRAVDDDIEK